jgi:hypothetical protein
MRRSLLSLLILLPVPALACKCLVSFPPCAEAASSDVIFIGTVESVDTGFLDRWHSARSSPDSLPVDEVARLQNEGTAASLARLKEIYLKMFPDLPAPDKNELQAAPTHRELQSIFDAIVSRGKRTHFKVRTLFKNVTDDDNADKDKDADKLPAKAAQKDDDDNANVESIDVWTDYGDCGFDFQKGETYLVYASQDEETQQLGTGICYRTKRLSEAGPDLSYLFFLKNGGDASTRMEGFVTSNPNQDRARIPNGVDAPMADVVVALKWGSGDRYTRSDRDGRFVFDGLTAGDYQLSVFSSGFPLDVQLLTGPNTVHVEANSCASEMLGVSPR